MTTENMSRHSGSWETVWELNFPNTSLIEIPEEGGTERESTFEVIMAERF